MVRRQTDPIIVARVRPLLDLRWSERTIIKVVKNKNIVVTKGTINKIKRMGKKTSLKNENLDPNYNGFSTLNKKIMKRLKKWSKPQTLRPSIIWVKSWDAPKKILNIISTKERISSWVEFKKH